MYVIGTAGHVDHGKSTLTRALTGIDPDRLQEEKLREMTIDLGFAWLDLPGAERVGIVDVPGHRDFIENMLAGVGGIDAAILVIAADEGVMPQTREHLAILDLLNVPTGLVALTKIDLVDDPEWLELVQLDVLDVLQGTILDGQPVLPVSAFTGAGLETFVAELSDVLAGQPARADHGNPRLPIDRVFTISGFGVVVTGTLQDGTLRVGQDVEIQPSGVRARIRGLQSHEESVEQAGPGQRVAVNLRGVEKSDLARGDVLGLPAVWHPTTLVDAWLRYLPAAHHPLAHNDEVKLFTGASETMARVRVLDREGVLPGEESWIQLRLEHPIVAARHDRYIIRRASPPETIGGGLILDTNPGRRWRRFRPEVAARFAVLLAGDPVAIALLALGEQRGPVRIQEIDLDADQIAAAVEQGDLITVSAWALHAAAWDRLTHKVARVLDRFHRAEPLRLGMPPEALRTRLRLEPDAFAVVCDLLAEHGHITVERGGVLRLPDYTVQLTAAQQVALDKLWAAFEDAPHTPPTAGQAEEYVGRAVLDYLIERGDLVALSSEVIFLPAVLREWIAFTQARLENGGTLTVAELRDHFQTTRRYALDFLERLDALGITRRKEDVRVLGSGKWELML
jgi:selenocysteine-specific elongation factor